MDFLECGLCVGLPVLLLGYDPLPWPQPPGTHPLFPGPPGLEKKALADLPKSIC